MFGKGRGELTGSQIIIDLYTLHCPTTSSKNEGIYYLAVAPLSNIADNMREGMYGKSITYRNDCIVIIVSIFTLMTMIFSPKRHG